MARAPTQAIDRARADAQGRCDGAGSEEIGYRILRHTRCGVPEGSAFMVHCRSEVLKSQPISLVRLPSGGLGLQNAKIAGLLLPGAPNPAFLVPPAAAGISTLPIQSSILSHPVSI